MLRTERLKILVDGSDGSLIFTQSKRIMVPLQVLSLAVEKRVILSPPSLARAIGTDVTEAGKVLAALEQEGLIADTREPNERGLVPIYEPTQKGFEMLKAVPSRNIFQRIFSGT